MNHAERRAVVPRAARGTRTAPRACTSPCAMTTEPSLISGAIPQVAVPSCSWPGERARPHAVALAPLAAPERWPTTGPARERPRYRAQSRAAGDACRTGEDERESPTRPCRPSAPSRSAARSIEAPARRCRRGHSRRALTAPGTRRNHALLARSASPAAFHVKPRHSGCAAPACSRARVPLPPLAAIPAHPCRVSRETKAPATPGATAPQRSGATIRWRSGSSPSEYVSTSPRSRRYSCTSLRSLAVIASSATGRL